MSSSSWIMGAVRSVFVLLALLFFGSMSYADNEGFIIIRGGHKPFVGKSLQRDLKVFLQEHPEFLKDPKLKVEIVISRQSQKKVRKADLDLAVWKLQETVMKAVVACGYVIDKDSINVNIVDMPPSLAEKKAKVEAEVEKRVLTDQSVQEQSSQLLSKLQESVEAYESLDSKITSKIVSIYSIITEEMERIRHEQPVLFDRQGIDAVTDSDVKLVLSKLSPEAKTQMLVQLAEVVGEDPYKVSRIFGIKDPALLRDVSATKRIEEGLLSFMVATKYIGSTLVKNLRIPLKDLSIDEMIQGMLPKLLAIAQSYGWNRSQLFNFNPPFFYSAFTMSVILDTFHGVEASGWLDFQNRMTQEKGITFVTRFNMLYSFATQMLFRINSCLAGKMSFVGVTSGVLNFVWGLYIYFTTYIGGTIGSQGYYAINKLHYDKFVFSKRFRDFVQQYIRDFFFIASGVVLGTGGETNPLTYLVFAIMQTLDLNLYYLSLVSDQRPVILIGDIDTLLNPKMGDTYPGLKDMDAVTPLKGLGYVEALKETGKLAVKALQAPFVRCVSLFSYLNPARYKKD